MLDQNSKSFDVLVNVSWLFLYRIFIIKLLSFYTKIFYSIIYREIYYRSIEIFFERN